MALGKCCCCVELRTGAIIIAVLGLIASFGSFQHGVVIGIIFFVYGLVQNLCLLHGAIKYNRTTTLVYLIMEAIFIILLLVNWILIIVGMASDEVKPCWKEENLNDDTKIDLGWNGWDEASCGVIVGVLVALFVVLTIMMAISIYFWACVYGFFVDLKQQQSPTYPIQA